MSKHTVPPDMPVYRSINKETSNMEVEEVRRPCTVGKTLLRRQRLLRSTWYCIPVITRLDHVFFAENHTCCCCCCKGLLHSSPTRQRKRLPPRLPQQSLLTSQASAADAPTANVQAGSKALTSATTPLLVTPLAGFLDCGSKTSKH